MSKFKLPDSDNTARGTDDKSEKERNHIASDDNSVPEQSHTVSDSKSDKRRVPSFSDSNSAPENDTFADFDSAQEMQTLLADLKSEQKDADGADVKPETSMHVSEMNSETAGNSFGADLNSAKKGKPTGAEIKPVKMRHRHSTENKPETKQQLRAEIKIRNRHRRLGKLVIISALAVSMLGAGINSAKGRVQQAVGYIADGDRISQTVRRDTFAAKKPTEIYDGNGKLVKKLVTLDTANKYVELKDINPYLSKGLVAVEDKRFYLHHGVDPYGTSRAVLAGLFGKSVQGGSTITQQLVKNMILQDQSRTVSRKVKEMVIAQNIEKKFSKKQILEFYLNNISYNHSNLGIGSAAHFYFGKDQKKLGINQAALLIGMINNPTLYDPLSHPQDALIKRNQILAVWKRNKVINQEQYEANIKKPLQLKITPTKVNSNVSNNYAMSYALNQAVVSLMHMQGFNEQYVFKTQKDRIAYHKRYNAAYNLAREQILKGGYKIYTNTNKRDQKALQKIVASVMGTDVSGYNPLLTSLAVVDNNTGEVVGIGAKSPKKGGANLSYLWNMQPGSAIKPLFYTLAYEKGYAPQSRISDVPDANDPKNWYTPKSYGLMSIRQAVKISSNVPTFHLAENMRKSLYMNKMAQMQFDDLGAYHQEGPIMSIGGFSYGVTSIEMASMLSAIARHGQFISPTNVNMIKYAGKVMYKNPQQTVQVFTPAASYEMIDTMKSVFQPGGLAHGYAPKNYPTKYLAAKTGTTDNNANSAYDIVSPQYSIYVIVAHKKSGASLTDAELNYAKVLGKKAMEYYLSNEKKVDFVKPSNVKKSGDNLYVIKSKKSESTQDLINQAAEESIRNRAKLNNIRRDALAYRIKYHLTLKQEKAREQKVADYLQAINFKQFNNLNQTSKYQSLINKARNNNVFVKRAQYHKKFNSQINRKQSQLNNMQAVMTARKEALKTSEIAKARQDAIDEAHDNNQLKANRLQIQLEKQKDKVVKAYENNDPDKEEQKQKLEEIIDKLRDLGINENDEHLTILEK